MHKQISEYKLKKTLRPVFQIVWDFYNFMIFSDSGPVIGQLNIGVRI